MSSCSTTRLRILCFHSFHLSGEHMRTQMASFSNFASTLDDLADLDFLDGGHRLPDEAAEKVPERMRRIFP